MHDFGASAKQQPNRLYSLNLAGSPGETLAQGLALILIQATVKHTVQLYKEETK